MSPIYGCSGVVATQTSHLKMDQEAQERFTWRMFLGLVQCLLALHTVHTFIYPNLVISIKLCFAAFLIIFSMLVVKLNH